ncbi:uncharacterized protein FOKN1_1284 [Thiohalobacter thiocyanaticus]|uniref:Uncharacterized protein n=1 Tax=Thiohalobacter thiocyanaticus TaxID=585455 RepID=A0A1Z4VQJ3_9GAMM|nr:uncharacterized protein FOKN1_1284 [Thiohalobacter thiocyanaticus]
MLGDDGADDLLVIGLNEYPVILHDAQYPACCVVPLYRIGRGRVMAQIKNDSTQHGDLNAEDAETRRRKVIVYK